MESVHYLCPDPRFGACSTEMVAAIYDGSGSQPTFEEIVRNQKRKVNEGKLRLSLSRRFNIHPKITKKFSYELLMILKELVEIQLNRSHSCKESAMSNPVTSKAPSQPCLLQNINLFESRNTENRVCEYNMMSPWGCIL